jgi:hypothetical protein
MELHGQCSICFLWHFQKEAVHKVLRCDLLLYLMTLTGVFKSDFTDYTNREFESYWEFCFIGSERLDWVEERACSRFVTEVNSIILGHILYTYIYIYIYIYMLWPCIIWFYIPSIQHTFSYVYSIIPLYILYSTCNIIQQYISAFRQL